MKKTIYIALSLLHVLSFCQTEIPSEDKNINLEPLRISTVEEIRKKHCKDEEQQKNLQNNDVAAPSQKQPLIPLDKWLVQSAMSNAPQLLKGVFLYLQSFASRCMKSNNFSKNWIIPSSHRFLLVGPPGSGKTTLAYALADTLGWRTIFQPASGFLGRFRNETSRNIQAFFNTYATDNMPKIIIIDELHKLFEHHEDDRSDDSQSATAFWQELDWIEKYHPEIVVIGTANSVDKLPAELKSRFSGKVIIIPLPTKQKKIHAFKDIIAHDTSIILHDTINDAYIETIIARIPNGSLRHMQLLIDLAKMFYYAEDYTPYDCISLTKQHFNLALKQLSQEASVFNQNILDKHYKKLKQLGLVLSVVINVAVVMQITNQFFTRTLPYYLNLSNNEPQRVNY